MTVLTDLDTTWTEKEQREDAFNARAALESATQNLDEAHQRIQDIVDSGNFDTVPADLKSTLNDWWTIIKQARTAIGANSDIMDVYYWHPPQS